MMLSFPNESAAYRDARNKLLDQEIALRREMEALAAARRALPPGGLIREDYEFDALDAVGRPAKVKLSELFQPGIDSLIVYNMMFPRHRNDDRAKAQTGITANLPREEGPCPSCVAFLDQLDGVMPHLSQTHTYVIIAKAPIERVVAFAKDRGWRNHKLLSSAGNRFKNDYGAEDHNGQQQPMTNVFQRTPEGVHHFWSSELLYAPTDPGQDARHMGAVEPLWNLMDFTPEGRAMNWHEQLDYDCCN